MLASPTKPPSVDEHPLGAGMLRFAERFTRYDPRFPESRHNPQVRLVYDESLGTELMDDWLAKGGPDGRPKAGPVAGADLVARAAYELHLARRFYERPESLEQQEYRERPDPDSRPVPLPERKPRVPRAGHRARRPPGAAAPARAGDRPGGRRRRAARPGPVAAGRGRGRRGHRASATRVRCQRTADGALVTVPGTRGLARRRARARRRRSASPCSTSTPTAARSRPTGSSGRCRGSSTSRRTATTSTPPTPPSAPPA